MLLRRPLKVNMLELLIASGKVFGEGKYLRIAGRGLRTKSCVSITRASLREHEKNVETVAYNFFVLITFFASLNFHL